MACPDSSSGADLCVASVCRGWGLSKGPEDNTHGCSSGSLLLLKPRLTRRKAAKKSEALGGCRRAEGAGQLPCAAVRDVLAHCRRHRYSVPLAPSCPSLATAGVSPFGSSRWMAEPCANHFLISDATRKDFFPEQRLGVKSRVNASVRFQYCLAVRGLGSD